MLKQNNRGMLVVLLFVFISVSHGFAQTVTIGFEDRYDGAFVSTHYRDQGVLFSSVYNPSYPSASDLTEAYPGIVATAHWPTTGGRSIQPTHDGRFHGVPYVNMPSLKVEFVLPGTDTPATTDYFSVNLDGSTDDGWGGQTVMLYALDIDGDLMGSTFVLDDTPNQLLSYSGEGIHCVVIDMLQSSGAGWDMETYDNITFNTPVPEPGTILIMTLLGAAMVKTKRGR